eukprot:1717223-Rhodomonas_salina.1
MQKVTAFKIPGKRICTSAVSDFVLQTMQMAERTRHPLDWSVILIVFACPARGFDCPMLLVNKST